MKLNTLFLPFAISVLLPTSALASGGPFAVDDAEIVERCQIETGWLQRNRDNNLFYFAPGCTLAGIEMTLGLSRFKQDGDSADGIGLQAKTVLRDVDDAPGLAIAVGVDGSRRSWRAQSVFTNLSLSHDLSDSLRLNANLGSTRDREARASSTTWGLGLDLGLGERLHLIGEVLGDDRSHRQGSQLGLRGILDPDRLHVDLVFGRNLEDIPGNWLGAGLVFEF